MKRTLIALSVAVLVISGCVTREAKPEPVVTDEPLEATNEALSRYFQAEDFPATWPVYVDEWADTNFLSSEDVTLREAECVLEADQGSAFEETFSSGEPVAEWTEPTRGVDGRVSTDTTSSWATVYANAGDTNSALYARPAYNECHEQFFGEYLDRAYKGLNPHVIRVDYAVEPLGGLDGIEGAWGYRATTTVVASSGMSTVKVFDWAGFTRGTREVNVTAEGLGAPFLDSEGQPQAASLLRTYSSRDADVVAAFEAAGGIDAAASPNVSLQ